MTFGEIKDFLEDQLGKRLIVQEERGSEVNPKVKKEIIRHNNSKGDTLLITGLEERVYVKCVVVSDDDDITKEITTKITFLMNSVDPEKVKQSLYSILDYFL